MVDIRNMSTINLFMNLSVRFAALAQESEFYSSRPARRNEKSPSREMIR